MMVRTSISLGLVAWLGAGCADDPTYITPPVGSNFSLEVDSAAETPPPAVMVNLPFRLEKPEEAMAREALAAQLQYPADQIPLVRLDDVDLSIEWSIKNLQDCDGQARFQINGGNQYFIYDPGAFVTDPNDPNVRVPPPLIGNMAPTEVPAGAVVTGVFREDQIREAAIDLELITRANVNPLRALYQIDKNREDMEIYMLVPNPDDPDLPPIEQPTGMFIPKEAWGQLTEFSMNFTAQNLDPACGSAHMVLEWEFRARDHRGLVHDHGMDADPAELTAFAPATYTPAIP